MIKINISIPISTSYNKNEYSFINEQISQEINNVNISQCFTIINDTTLLKNSFFYSNNFYKELCTKLAISLKYKEDIYFPKFFHKCFPLCNSCSSYSSKNTEMNCISCLNGFKLKNGNCYLDKKYNEKKRNNELSIIFNTLNLNEKINSNNIKKKYINGNTYLFNENKNSHKKRRLTDVDELDDTENYIINREVQSSLSDDKTQIEYNFHIELSPYYFLAERCISQGKYFIEDKKCVESCTPQLETYFNYPVIEIKVGPGDSVSVCDCSFRCCKKRINNLSKSLDRGYIDGSYEYFRRPDGFCGCYKGTKYENVKRKNHYLLAQDFVPCYFPIYNNNEIEFYLSGYRKTIIGNRCITPCPIDDENIFYYYNPTNSRCYKCPDNCIECNNIPNNENGYCTRCKEGFNINFKGFCYQLCPFFYGDDNNGSCRNCNTNEIYLEGNCIIKQSAPFNYGNSANPSFEDKNTPNLFHKCLEFIGGETYLISKDETICNGITCPEHYYEIADKGLCLSCPNGCDSCFFDNNNILCTSCSDGYLRTGNSCKSEGCPFFTLNNGLKACFDKCPEGFLYLNDGTKSEYECVSDCGEISSENRIFNTLYGLCALECNNDESSIIEEDNLCLEDCIIEYPENSNGNCENCALKSKYNYNGICVVKEENFDEIYFVLSGEQNEKYNKVGSCYIIDEKGDYHPEHIKSREINPSLCPNDCPSNFEKKYDEKGEILCVKCYKTCETCDHTGVAGNHKCTKCKNGYEFSSKIFGLCDKICNEGDYFYYNENREKICADQCPIEMNYKKEGNEENFYLTECLNNCFDKNLLLIENTFICIEDCPEGYYKKDLLCVEKCPQFFGYVDNSKECIKCSDLGLYSYNGKCYNSEIEIPKDTYIKDSTTIIPDDEEPKSGIDNDGTLHDCFEIDIESSNNSFITGFFAKKHNCTKACPEGYQYDSNEKKCFQCPARCPYCHEITGCEDECPDDYYMISNEDDIKCVSTCPDNSPIIDSSNFCDDQCYDDEVKILYSGDENLGNSNYKCSDKKCKELSLFYYSLTHTCYPPQSIPDDTYFNSDNQRENENELNNCLKKISDSEYITGFFYTISKCRIQCPDYFYYAGNNKCKKCHSLCKTCFGEGTNKQNNCLSCEDTENRILNPYLFNCEKKCDGPFHYSNETKKIVCDKECPKNNFIDEETGECLSKCNKLIDNNYCVNECPEGKSEFNGYCLTNVTIPVNIITKTIITPVEKTYIPYIPPIPPISSIPIYSYETSISSSIHDNNKEDNNYIDIVDMIKKIERNFFEYITYEYNIAIKNGNISLCGINMNENGIKCNNSENILYLNECEEKIKNSFPSDTKFYLMQIDLNEKNNESENKKSFSSQSKYKLYRENGEEINISEICKNTNISIGKKINLKNNLENEEVSMRLLEEGINLYDPNDPFFNDICYPYQDENGNDIPLESRKKDFYQNTVMCIEGCEYSGINKNTSKIMCNCNAESLIIKNDEDDNSILGYLDDNVNSLIIKVASSDTIGVVKCYERTFKKDNIKKNIGFWIYIGFLFLFLMLLSCLLCFGYNSLNSYLYQFSTEKKIENEIEENEEEIITKKVIVSSYNENINSNENSNPPKRGNTYSNEDSISEEKTRTKTNKKITIGFDQKINHEYPRLSISNFGKGYKLSNNFEEESIDNYQTPTKLSEKRYEEVESINYISSNNNIRQNSPSSTPFINNNKIENNISIKKNYISQVELEPEGALLAANNFFDTCRIVKMPKEFNEQEENYENNINKKFKSNINKNSMYHSNILNRSSFFQPNKKVVKLPGFPDPQYEKENYSEEENHKRKYKNNNIPSSSKNRRKTISKQKLTKNNNYLNLNNKNDREDEKYKDNPLNKYNMDTMYTNDLEYIDEKYDDSSYISSEQSKNEKYNKYNVNYINSSLPKYRSRNSYMNTNSSDNNFSKQPITINKYYITNNTKDDKYEEKNKQINEKKSISEHNKKNRKRLERPYNEVINSEEKQFKNEGRNKYNNYNDNKNHNKIVTISRKKNIKNIKKENSELNNYDLDTADFEEVMLNDHRSFCGIYCSFLSNFQIYISICFSHNIFVPWVVRASICLFTLELYFTFTALLMKVTQFEKRYKYKKDIDILYLIKNEFSNIVYTTLITKIMNFVAMYIFVHYSITKVIKDYGYQGEIFIREIKKALYKLKCKYYVFIIIFIILTCVQGYFISCFCAVYIGSVKEWIYSSIIAFIFNLVLSFFFIFLAALFRTISICCQSWLLFMISNFFLSLA